MEQDKPTEPYKGAPSPSRHLGPSQCERRSHSYTDDGEIIRTSLFSRVVINVRSIARLRVRTQVRRTKCARTGIPPMKRYSNRSNFSTLSEINVTPLLDLALVLLIIFMITTFFFLNNPAPTNISTFPPHAPLRN